MDNIPATEADLAALRNDLGAVDWQLAQTVSPMILAVASPFLTPAAP